MSPDPTGTDIVMPALEMAQERGLLVRWLKTEGEFVKKGDPLMEIETDKALAEIESPDSGILSHLSAKPGDEVPVGRVIAVLLPPAARSAAPETQEGPRPCSARDELAPRVGAESQPGSRAAAAELVAEAEQRERPRRVLASPKARRLAAEANLDLSSIEGSGPGKAVLPEDVLRMSSRKPAQADFEYTSIDVKGMRRIIAERLQRSAQEAPHIAFTQSVDMSQARHHLQVWNSASLPPASTRPGLTSLICKAIAAALLQHPRLNCHFLGSEIREYRTVHLGVAVALPEGLVVPVLRNAGKKSLVGIQSELADLTSRAKAGKLRSDEMKGGTFTLSNLGMFGIEQFTAVLNPPEVGILSVGAIVDTPVGLNGQIALRPMMHITVSVDHRAVDGAVAARFLGTLKQILEAPEPLFG